MTIPWIMQYALLKSVYAVNWVQYKDGERVRIKKSKSKTDLWKMMPLLRHFREFDVG